ncbi:MAG TPA: FRG domain-containing protein [Parafilimonas sp.]|nr:FRG domain-containing protein [Parafilimonas sp.]
MEKHHRAKSLSDFIKIVNDIQNQWTELEGEFIFPWFRGVSQASHKLQPGIYRKEGQDEYEDSYRHDFQQKGYPLLTDTTFGVPVSDWEWYFIMQHYGMPTRLLDWTEGSLIALYFALFYKDLSDSTNPCIWMLNPFWFNKILHKKSQIFLFTDQILKPYLSEIWSGEPLPKNPIAFQPAYKSKRIAAQKGCFTIHGSKKNPLEEIESLSACLQKIEIEYYYMDLVKAELSISGITESTLFPELNGLSRELKEYWRDF